MSDSEDPGRGDVTQLLEAWRGGDEDAANRLFPHLYAELKRIAQHVMSSERSDHTLQPTALVHDAYLKLAGGDSRFQDRAHFLAVAARAMRQLMVDHARAKRADKRKAGEIRVTLGEDLKLPAADPTPILDLHRALEQLSELAPRRGQATELHLFAGMTHEEVATVLKVSVSTVRNDLRFALAWLERELNAPN